MIEIIVVSLMLIFIFGFLFFAPENKEVRYQYVEEKDEDGNIIEKVIDHKDKGEE